MAETDKTSAKTAPDAAADSPAESADSAQPAETPATESPPDTETPADADAAGAPAALSAEALLERLTQAQAEHAQAQDDLLRARAETENVRRRAQNEIVAARKFAIENFARELLSVKDSLDRAAAVALDEGASEAVRQMKEGLGLTLKQLDLAMARFAVVEVEAAPGVKFDPQCHQAVSMTPSEEVEADHIVTVVQKGFLLKERLLRPAMVVVAGAAENKR